MPVVPAIILTHGTLYCWHITETLIELSTLATAKNIVFNTIGANLRMQQSVACKLLINEFISNDDIIYINKKPTVINTHISLSHTNHYAYVIHTHSECGLDVELISEKALRIKLKFCNPQELLLFKKYNFTENELYTLLWCAKEAIYKRYNDGYSFVNDIKISTIDKVNQEITAQINTPATNENCTVYYLLHNNKFIAYVI
ncbi:MAG: 4'-phosphopantetheinyl transferase superfamily protein [Bacteroidia bacterium]|nr:4'-phosphopantetheinyl transferase superfamily protein [Bacteroidia bacterium]